MGGKRDSSTRRRAGHGGRAVGASRQVLEQAPTRGLALLRAVGADPNIRAALDGLGFTEAELDRGWSLLRDACSTTVVELQAPQEYGMTLAELNADGGRALRLVRVALRHFHPAYEEVLLGAPPKTQRDTRDAALRLGFFLNAWKELENARGRTATRKADQAVLATLEARGMTRAERERLAGLIDRAGRLPHRVPAAAEPDKELHAERLVALHAWVQGWCATARTVITRRDQLIRLGVGRRRMPTRGQAAEPGVA